jgi:hypothetical protein
MYWIAKTKPIFFQLGHYDPSRIDKKFHGFEYAAINEIFAYTLCIDMLGIDPDNINKRLYNDMLRRFRYDLYYRDTNPKQLFLTLELLHGSLQVRR